VRPTKEERERSASYRWSPPGEIVAGAIMWWFTLTAAIGYLAWRFFHYAALIIPLVVGVVVWRVASHVLDEHWKEIRETLRREKEEGLRERP
jgi:hypothetical protein